MSSDDTMADPAQSPRPTVPPTSLLDRPQSQRLQEFKYRFGQSVVFGVPVIALQTFGRRLGGPESDRWVSLFQALLAGWVVYVASAGMLAEGALLRVAGRRVGGWVAADSLIAGAVVGFYLLSLPHLIMVLCGAAGRAAPWPSTFHWCVAALAAWTGLRWRQIAATGEAKR